MKKKGQPSHPEATQKVSGQQKPLPGCSAHCPLCPRENPNLPHGQVFTIAVGTFGPPSEVTLFRGADGATRPWRLDKTIIISPISAVSSLSALVPNHHTWDASLGHCVGVTPTTMLTEVAGFFVPPDSITLRTNV